ncbi:putative uso1/p115-like vesicle tethering protein [Helianthus annuus]|nr:putative uso1/p115-like vesicle tethering protein [Helianthus annuus]KAJ0634565.1 putative uso1/p115-like vesicle tethering protein [Helianthus annuus]
MKKMDLVSGYKGMVGLVFGNENNSTSNEDSYVERLLDCISNGKLPEDRRNAMAELQSVVAESHAAQLAFGEMGFPVLLGVLRERDDDVEMVRGALETLVSALTPIAHPKLHANEVQPALMNADLLSREGQSISLLLGLLEEDDFYIRYYTLQLLTALLTNSPNRLQEAILAIPRGITRLMDMLMDREVIRNEALLLLTYLTREAEEIQKILVFEGAFEKIFSIIKEEGGSEGGVVVQDCLELLNNLLRNNSSNQVLLRETIGFDSLISILKLRGTTYSFTQQKTINLLSVLETIRLLLNGDSNTNILTNKTILVQRKVLDYLLMLGVESQWAPVSVRCLVFHCIGDLISGHRQSLDALASKSLGDGSEVEPALNSILRIILRTSSMQEFIAADYVFKSFCEHNSDGQKMLASTLIPHPMSITNARFEEDVNMSFGSMLLHGLAMSEHDGDLEISSRAASILSHVMKDNIQCKEKVLQIKLESSMPSLESAEPLLHRMVKYLALASSRKGKEEKSTTPRSSYFQPIILKLLVTWLYDCPKADLLNRNATLAEDLANTGGGGSAETKPRSNNGSERVQIETLRRDLQEVSQRLEMFKTENSNIQNEALSYKNLAEKMETDLKSLSDAYNSLEQANYSLEMEVRALKSGGATLGPDIEKIKAEAREEAQKESEGELGDLLVCLGQEQSKVEKLSARLVELGEDVDVLLEGIGEDETGLLDDDDDED